MPSKRKSKRKRINYDVDKRKQWRKLKRKPVINATQLKDAWDRKKTVQENLKDMGLAFDTNKAMKIPKSTPTIIEEVPLNETNIAKIPKVIESMETEAALGEKEKRFLVSSEDVHFCTYMINKYEESYKSMARDPKNYFQLTPKQIRNKIRSFKRSKVQYKRYLDQKNGSQTESNIVDADMET